MSIRIVVIDDHPLVRAGVRSELEESGADLTVVGQAADVDGAVAACRDLQPDVALLDVHLPGGQGGGGAEVVARCADIPRVRFLALSVSDSPEDVVSVIRAGARGYVTKSISPGDLLEAIKRVASGDAAFSPRLAGFVLDAFGTREVAVHEDELDLLSARELQSGQWTLNLLTTDTLAAMNDGGEDLSTAGVRQWETTDMIITLGVPSCLYAIVVVPEEAQAELGLSEPALFVDPTTAPPVWATITQWLFA